MSVKFGIFNFEVKLCFVGEVTKSLDVNKNSSRKVRDVTFWCQVWKSKTIQSIGGNSWLETDSAARSTSVNIRNGLYFVNSRFEIYFES
jgi:hypothetical protein